MTVLLPPVDWNENAEALAARAAAAAPPRAARVLLVEDEMAVRELLEEMLARHGFDVASAETAEQAALIASERDFDVLLTDIDLPGMNGAQLSASLHERLPHLAVVLMSGYPEDGALEQAHPDERRVLLRKPFSTQDLVARLRAALSGRG